MIKVKLIDLKALTTLSTLPQSIVSTAGRQLIVAARAKWVKLAQEKLSSSRIDYIQGIQSPKTDKGSYTISLVGKLPNMIEQGFRPSGYQMQEYLLGDNTSGWKTSKDGGRYRAIPFSHKGPGAGPVGGQAMGSQFVAQMSAIVGQKAAAAAALKHGQSIHNKAKRLITAAEKKAGKKGRTALKAGLAPLLQQHHTTDIFSGMRVKKQVVAGGKKVQKTFSTFRMISEGPGGEPRPSGRPKWYHPGFRARNFAQEVSDYVEKIAPAVVDSLTKGLTGQK